eukprot:1238267-Alexandrium_andersonii.AAC.1
MAPEARLGLASLHGAGRGRADLRQVQGVVLPGDQAGLPRLRRVGEAHGKVGGVRSAIAAAGELPRPVLDRDRHRRRDA